MVRVRIDGPFDAGQRVIGTVTHPGYEGKRMEIGVKDIESEKLFPYTWHPFAIDPNLDCSQETPTLVEFRLEPTASGTLLTVTESDFDQAYVAKTA